LSNIIENNAFRILGLDSSANQKEILKRYKEIINRLKIDDFPDYDLDLNLPRDLRTEESVNDALKRLQNPKSNVVESFFWLQIRDTVDENALNDLRNNNLDSAILTWKNASEIENSTAFFYKKNLNLLYCLSLKNEENDDFLNESIVNWNEIIKSDKFWKLFEKTHEINNERETNTDLINDFRNNVGKQISDIYAELYQKYMNPKYIKNFQEIIGAQGEKTEKTLLKPIHQSIYDTIEELKKIDFEKNLNSNQKVTNQTEIICDNCGKSSLANPDSPTKFSKYVDGSVLCKECRKNIGKEWQRKIAENETVEGSAKVLRLTHKSIGKLELQLEQLREIGLYDDVQSKVVRDHAAQAIRDASVHIHNMAHMSHQSAELMNLAIKIAGTESMREQLLSDSKKIQEIAEDDDKTALVLPIPKLFGKKDLVVKNNFMEYKEKKIYYKDVVAISYHNEESKFNFVIYSLKDGIDLTFSNHPDLWYELVNIAKQYIEPIIVEKLVKAIFEQNRSIQIGNISIDKNGFHKSKLLRGIESVLWTDSHVYAPKLHQGTVILFKDKNNFSKEFTTIKLEYSNAAVLPELIQACYNEFVIRQQK